MQELSSGELNEINKSQEGGYRDIFSNTKMTVDELNRAVDDEFGKVIKEENSLAEEKTPASTNELPEKETGKIDDLEEDSIDTQDVKTLVNDYVDDLQENSECQDTVDWDALKDMEVKDVSSDEVARLRDEFKEAKSELKKQWEIKNNREWPKYEEDVYSDSGKLIRQKGDDYDAHHIQPLKLGGTNTVENITPMRAEVHYDKQGIHAPNSPCAKLMNKVGA